MNSRKPRGSGRTPAAGQRGGPFAERDFQRNLGPRRRPSRPQDEPAFDENAVDARPRGRRGKGAGAARAKAQHLDEVHVEGGERLQKVLAAAGVASRRVCEDLIAEGRVEVDGVVVTEPGVRVDPARSRIHVDGISVQTDVTKQYYVFNKPRGVISTMVDPEARPSIATYLKPGQEGLFHVGRLDNETEGLLILTNDGELANRLTHPSYEVPKTYLVQTRGPLPKGVSNRLREGVELEDGLAKVDSFKLVDSTPGHVLVEVVLHSGKNRIVRRMFQEIGHPVERLVRVKVGPILLGDQKQGSVRALSAQELGHLKALVGL
ncbi:pseudouridine synthase [Micrococcus sp.]|uniref:pseudouridine synthase n=1 Tax=Micrococcus sp. TaxID=1271 RepID=UPI002A90FDA4|nr:pseudouridine synthase [Micrococcus sp.]MDY6055592.1 pseudouridine synthase [Micrococcus sp.]